MNSSRYRLPAARHPLAAAALVLSCQSALAQQQQLPTVEVSGVAERSGIGLQAPAVTASRLNLSALDTPASVESLSTDAMLERGDVLIKDAITRSTGLTEASNPGNGIAYSARGFSGSGSVALLENGQRLQVGSGTATYPADPWGYDYVEVLRGPGSLAHGSGTTGATINAVRKTPQRAPGWEALLGAGSGDTVRAGVGATGKLSERAAFRIDAYADRSKGLIERGDARRGKIMSSVRIDLAEHLELDLQLDHSMQEPVRYFGTPLVDGRIDERLRERNYNAADAQLRYVDDKALARLSWRPTPALTVSNELAWFKTRRDWRNIESYQYVPATGMVERSDYIAIRHDQEQTGNRLEARWVAGGNRLVAGWETATINFMHTNNSPYGGASSVPLAIPDPGRFDSPDPFLPNFASDTTTHAFYLDDALSVGERLVLLGGLRHDRYQVARVSLLGAPGVGMRLRANAVRLGLSYKPAAATALYGQVSTGSDPVTSILSVNLANSRFDLSTSRQLEAGIKQALAGGALEWSAAVYRIRKDDIITRDPDNPALSVQGGSQTSKGLEATVSAGLARGWRIDANAAWADAEFDTLIEAGNVSRAGKRPANIPKLSANLWLNYRTGAWRAGAGLRHVGERYLSNANTQALPSYTTLDASAAWQIKPNVGLQLALRNLTDKLYATSSYGASQYLLGARRNAELTVNLRY